MCNVRKTHLMLTGRLHWHRLIPHRRRFFQHACPLETIAHWVLGNQGVEEWPAPVLRYTARLLLVRTFASVVRLRNYSQLVAKLEERDPLTTLRTAPFSQSHGRGPIPPLRTVQPKSLTSSSKVRYCAGSEGTHSV